ncbi:MAG: NAD+ synthase [Candidatus Kapaibacterium sp.]
MMNYNKVEQVLTAFLKNEINRIGVHKAVIGLSGGIDSAVSAFLTVKALGPENVLCVMMPYKTSSKSSLEDAQKVVKILNVKSKIVDISKMVDAYIDTLEGDVSIVRKGNVMARIRMIVLYDESAKENGIVVGTSNKTELFLGYSTLHGDSACAINPLGQLYKTQIFELAKHLNVPKEILEKKPSADLWAGQTDEEEMGITYAKVDKLLKAMIDEGKSDAELQKMGFEMEYILKVQRMIKRNEFKGLSPVVANLTDVDLP